MKRILSTFIVVKINGIDCCALKLNKSLHNNLIPAHICLQKENQKFD
jgi:hypothetical protein